MANLFFKRLRSLAWLAPVLMLIVTDLAVLLRDHFLIFGNTLHDYDTLMRMAYLRDVIATGDWHHGITLRNNAPYGMVLHWTKPFNWIVLGLDSAFSFLPPDKALHYAGYWTGPVVSLATIAAAYWAARRIMAPLPAAYAAMLIEFSKFLAGYGKMGSANHHTLLCLDTVLMAGLVLMVAQRRDAWRAALLAGLMAGFCIWTSFELIVIAAPAFFLIFMLWIGEGEERLPQLWLSTAGFSLMVTLGLLADPPSAGFSAVEFDHISLPFQTLASLPLLIVFAADLAKPKTAAGRARLFGLAGAVCVAFWLICYPSALTGVQGGMDPYVAREWLSTVGEVQPITELKPLLTCLGPGVLSLLLGLLVFRKTRYGWMICVLFAVLSILGQAHYRFYGYSLILAAFFLAYCIERLRSQTGEAGIIGRYLEFATGLGFAVFWCLQIGYILFKPLPPMPMTGDCNPYHVREALADKEWLGNTVTDPIFMTDVDLTSAMLYWTPMREVAGNYHRDSAGLKDNYMFFRDPGDRIAHDIARRRGVSYVMICKEEDVYYEFSNSATAKVEDDKEDVDFEPEDTLYVSLLDEEPPTWLKERSWPVGTKSNLLLYQVVDPSRPPPHRKGDP